MKNNLIFIGMPGCGKSTIGVLTAKVLCLSFIDTDLLIQEKVGKRLQDVIDSEGLDAFYRIEERTLSKLSASAALIATGGSAIYYPSAMKHLREIGNVIYLRSSLETIKEHLADFSKRGIAMPRDMTIDELYFERAPLYEQYADVIVDVSADSIADNMELVVRTLRERGIRL